jgi:ribosome-associated toxin RatA of RatAB toxin-antitoxin module
MNVRRSALIPRSAGDTFDLIEQAEHYPSFLPWCSHAIILERTEDVVAARITVKYRGLEFPLATRNLKRRPTWMAVRLVKGPFRQFEGEWRLTELTPGACKIEFDLAYEFDIGLVDRLAGRIFDGIADKIVDAFAQRAERLPIAQRAHPAP